MPIYGAEEQKEVKGVICSAIKKGFDVFQVRSKRYSVHISIYRNRHHAGFLPPFLTGLPCYFIKTHSRICIERQAYPTVSYSYG